MPGIEAEFTAELWRWDARVETWAFVSLPEDLSAELADHASTLERRGFGAIKVEVRCGTSSWSTSVFPDAASGRYVLPVKASVRRTSGLDVGDTATFHVTAP